MGHEETVRLHPNPGDARAGLIVCGVGAVVGLVLAVLGLVVGELYASVLLGSGLALVAIFGGVALLCARSPEPGRIYLDLTSDGLREQSVGSSRAFGWRDLDGFEIMDESEGGPVVSFRLSDSYPGRRPRDRFGIGRRPDGVLNDTYGMSARDLANLLNGWRLRHIAKPA